MNENPTPQMEVVEPCPPHEFGDAMSKRIHHFRNGHYWFICSKCGYSVRSGMRDD